jgi:hypothetical protein
MLGVETMLDAGRMPFAAPNARAVNRTFFFFIARP